MKRWTLLMGLAAGTACLTGCVERRYVINSDPPGAMVYRNGQPLGPTPVDDHFVYYGKYDFTLIKEGYETLRVEQDIPTPWYEYFPLDFVTENLFPWPITDVRRFNYRLEPKKLVQTDQMLRDADALRNRGRAIGAPVPLPARPPELTADPFNPPPAARVP